MGSTLEAMISDRGMSFMSRKAAANFITNKFRQQKKYTEFVIERITPKGEDLMKVLDNQPKKKEIMRELAIPRKTDQDRENSSLNHETQEHNDRVADSLLEVAKKAVENGETPSEVQERIRKEVEAKKRAESDERKCKELAESERKRKEAERKESEAKHREVERKRKEEADAKQRKESLTTSHVVQPRPTKKGERVRFTSDACPKYLRDDLFKLEKRGKQMFLLTRKAEGTKPRLTARKTADELTEYGMQYVGRNHNVNISEQKPKLRKAEAEAKQRKEAAAKLKEETERQRKELAEAETKREELEAERKREELVSERKREELEAERKREEEADTKRKLEEAEAKQRREEAEQREAERKRKEEAERKIKDLAEAKQREVERKLEEEREQDKLFAEELAKWEALRTCCAESDEEDNINSDGICEECGEPAKPELAEYTKQLLSSIGIEGNPTPEALVAQLEEKSKNADIDLKRKIAVVKKFLEKIAIEAVANEEEETLKAHHVPVEAGTPQSLYSRCKKWIPLGIVLTAGAAVMLYANGNTANSSGNTIPSPTRTRAAATAKSTNTWLSTALSYLPTTLGSNMGRRRRLSTEKVQGLMRQGHSRRLALERSSGSLIMNRLIREEHRASMYDRNQ